MDVTVTDPLVGRLLDGRYRVTARIARGGMATVYRAVDTRLDRVVAVKIMHPGLGDDTDFARRFVREAQSAARLSHPNVVAVFDQGDDDGTLFLAMEYVEGRTLRDVIREEGPLPPQRALALMEPVLSALAAAHGAGFVHRDVKPENVLIADDGRVLVADFGLVRAVTAASASSATAGLLIGTVSYLAPEVVLAGTSDARCDVYAAGVLLYELLTGRKPHQGESPIQVAYQHVHEDIPPPSGSVAGIPAYVDELVLQATARDRDRRPADAKALLGQLRRARRALASGAADPAEATVDLSGDGSEQTLVVAGGSHPSPTAAPRRPGRSIALALVAVLLVGLAGAGGWYYAVGRYTSTPSVLSRPEGQARSVIRAAGLGFVVSGAAFSDSVPAGHVLSTDPAPGQRVLEHGTVTVVLSKGPQRFDVPTLVGRTRAQAISALGRRHLRGQITSRYDDTVPAGSVVTVAPAPGTPLASGSTVRLTLSKGPAPIRIPDLADRSGSQSAARLRSLGFAVRVSSRHDATVPKGSVISQQPSSGVGHRGDRIALVVSLGPTLVQVPDVDRYGVGAATAALEAAGFRVQVRQYYVSFGLGFVVKQTPTAGSMAPRGSTVVIYLA